MVKKGGWWLRLGCHGEMFCSCLISFKRDFGFSAPEPQRKRVWEQQQRTQPAQWLLSSRFCAQGEGEWNHHYQRSSYLQSNNNQNPLRPICWCCFCFLRKQVFTQRGESDSSLVLLRGSGYFPKNPPHFRVCTFIAPRSFEEVSIVKEWWCLCPLVFGREKKTLWE